MEPLTGGGFVRSDETTILTIGVEIAISQIFFLFNLVKISTEPKSKLFKRPLKRSVHWRQRGGGVTEPRGIRRDKCATHDVNGVIGTSERIRARGPARCSFSRLVSDRLGVAETSKNSSPQSRSSLPVAHTAGPRNHAGPALRQLEAQGQAIWQRSPGFELGPRCRAYVLHGSRAHRENAERLPAYCDRQRASLRRHFRAGRDAVHLGCFPALSRGHAVGGPP